MKLICLKCNTEQEMQKRKWGLKEKEFSWYCPNCDDLISQNAVKEKQRIMEKENHSQGNFSDGVKPVSLLKGKSPDGLPKTIKEIEKEIEEIEHNLIYVLRQDSPIHRKINILKAKLQTKKEDLEIIKNIRDDIRVGRMNKIEVCEEIIKKIEGKREKQK